MSRALFLAVRAGNVQRVRAALAGGADPNARLEAGWTAVRGRGKRSSRPAEFDDEPESSPTPLTEALTHNHVDVARVLIEAGANVNTADGDGLRPLDVALLYAGRAAVRLLIESGATVNYVRPDGNTGLMEAGGVGDVSLVELFLAAGADPNVTREIDGLTVADIQVLVIASQNCPAGMRKSSKRILDVLAAAGATVRTVEEIERIKDARWRAQASLRR
jgi:ankyrin repeat protein